MSDLYQGCARYPGSNFTIKWMAGADHFSPLEQPERVTTVMRRLLTES
jgi:hypothetical protein